MKAIVGFLLLVVSLQFTQAEEEQGYLKLAKEKRQAVLLMWVDQTTFVGCFISEDGLALCGLQAVAGDGAPNRVETIGGISLKMGVVRAIFPEQDLALVQFKHRPKQWLTVDPRPVELGERVAILDITIQLRGKPIPFFPTPGCLYPPFSANL